MTVEFVNISFKELIGGGDIVYTVEFKFNGQPALQSIPQTFYSAFGLRGTAAINSTPSSLSALPREVSLQVILESTSAFEELGD